MTEFIYDLVYGLPIAQILVLMTGPVFGVPADSKIGCIVASVFLILIIALIHASLKTRLMIVGITAAFITGAFFVIGEEGRKSLMGEYSFLLTCLILAVAAVIVGLLISKKKWIRRLAALAFIVTAVFYMVMRLYINKFAAAMLFLTVLLCVLEEVQRNWIKSGFTSVKSHMAVISPILLVLSLAVFWLPAPDEPYDWEFVRSGWERVVDRCEKIVGELTHKTEEYYAVGFSDNSSFFAPFRQSDRKIMKVKTYLSNPNYVYLSGRIYDKFEDNSWDSSLTDEVCDRMLDTMELKCAVDKFDEENERDYMSRTENEVESLLFNTRFIFTPSKMLLNKNRFISCDYIETNADVKATEVIKNGQKYTVGYYKINNDNPALYELIDNAAPINKSEWNKTLKSFFEIESRPYSYDSYLAYKLRMKEEYSDEVILPDKVNELLDKLWEGSTGDYDKMKRLERFLSGLTYNSAPSDLPDTVLDDTSYLEYFICRSREGYCVHYATTFVLIARSAGLPARYVQGYRLKKSNGGYTVITDSDAHAWPEVYFENFGWVSFEPTPGYEGAGGWNTDNDYYDERNVPEHMDIDLSDLTEEDVPAEDEVLGGFDFKLIRIPLLASAAFAILFILLSRLIFNLRYKKMDAGAKVRTMTVKNLKILKRLGYELDHSMTLREYRSWIEETEEGKIKTGFLTVYEELTYSDKKASNAEVKVLEEDYKLLKDVLKAKSLFDRLTIWVY